LSDIVAIVMVFGGFFTFLLAISPVGRAVADRIRGGGLGGSNELAHRLDDLIEEIETVRHEVMELGERVDFAERMLARSNDPRELHKSGADEPEEGPRH
jgi:hypothetical protein